MQRDPAPVWPRKVRHRLSSAGVQLVLGIALAVLLPAASGARAGEASGFTRSYQVALRITQDPPKQESLSLACGARLKRRLKSPDLKNPYVSFIRSGRPGVVLVTFAPQPVDSPEKDLWLTPVVRLFSAEEARRRMERGAFPFAAVTSGPMKDWGYVFDRNGDGLADYLCFLDGPIAVRQTDVPADFPRKKRRLTGEQMKALLFATKYAFYHIVDEDFDGSVDLIVHPTFEQDSPFVEKSVALRWRKSQRLIGSSWYFEEDPSVKAGKPKVGGNDHWVRLWPHMHETLPFTANDFSRLAELLPAVNLAARECKPWARDGE